MPIRVGYSRNLARKVLEELELKILPIPLKKVSDYYKLELWEYDKLPASISAVIKIDKKIILVNPTQPIERKRFSIAHEIGHFLLDHHQRQKIETEAEDIIFTKDLENQFNQEEESEANEFAAELLMPIDLMKKSFLNNPKNPKVLAEEFKVSEQAIWVRLSKLNLLKYL